MSDPPSRRSAAANPDGNAAAQIAHLRSLVAHQQRTIAEQRAEIDTLRKQAGSAPTDHRPAPPPLPNAPTPASDVAAKTSTRLAERVAGADFTVVFDGGSLGNPGRGYGSYQIVGPDGLVAQRRAEYGDGITNNQAEYRTLVEALEDLRDRLGRDAARSTVAIRGDSQLVVHQVTGRWKVKHPEMRPLHAQVMELLRGFARSDIAWHRRDASVRILRH